MGELFGVRQRSFRTAGRLVRSLQVTGYRVIDHCRYALVLQVLLETVAMATRHFQGILMEDMRTVLAAFSNGNVLLACECIIVMRRRPVPLLGILVQGG